MSKETGGAAVKVGDEVWMFDINRRVYENNKGSPIFNGHFYKAQISGETARSFIVSRKKYPKNNLSWMYTDEQKLDAIWADENRYKIREIICNVDIETLKKIAAILDERGKT